MLPMVNVPLKLASVMLLTVMTSFAMNVWPVKPEIVTEFAALTAALAPTGAWFTEQTTIEGTNRDTPVTVESIEGRSSNVTWPEVTREPSRDFST